MNNKYNINAIALTKAKLETYSLNIKQIKLCLQAGWAFLFGKKICYHSKRQWAISNVVSFHTKSVLLMVIWGYSPNNFNIPQVLKNPHLLIFNINECQY